MNYRQKVLAMIILIFISNTFIIISFNKSANTKWILSGKLNAVTIISNPISIEPNIAPNLQTYGAFVSDCDALIHSLYLTLNIFKLDSLNNDKKFYPMHIFWTCPYTRPKLQQYTKLLYNNTYKLLIKDLKNLIYDSVIDTNITLNESNFDIKFLVRNPNITVPELFMQKFHRFFSLSWRLAFDKLLLFDKTYHFKDYKSILMLDIDIIFIKSIKHLFNTYNDKDNINLVIPSISEYGKSKGKWKNKHLNGGITYIKPDTNIFDNILEISSHNITNTDILREIYGTSEQTFYAYLFLGPQKQRGKILNDSGSKMKILPHYYNQVVRYCAHIDMSFYKNVVSWHFTTSPKPWKLVIYDDKLKKNKINYKHWYIIKWKQQFVNKTSYNDNSYVNMNQSNCEYVILRKWLKEIYNKHYQKMEIIKHKCYQIVSQYY